MTFILKTPSENFVKIYSAETFYILEKIPWLDSLDSLSRSETKMKLTSVMPPIITPFRNGILGLGGDPRSPFKRPN